MNTEVVKLIKKLYYLGFSTETKLIKMSIYMNIMSEDINEYI